MGRILLFFIGAGLLEIFVFIEVGAAIGAWSTIALILLTAILGLSLVRIQGLQTLMEAQTKLNRGETPAREMVSGMMLALSGVLLLLPGFVTDFAGVLLLLPPVRNALAERFLSRAHIRGNKGHTFTAEYYYHSETRVHDQDKKGVTFEGEVEHKDDK
ncbi:FxsA family protein [Oceanimonas pelagia]|uniref:FxsA family protein n=1 Tax=Oceanimonas pelagia TaxID=3028314 RepID=A0AA50KM15_9GAMM|nr:FxsA family protein [Oceanimonas pelagia]WMC09934.1 FxsA family protein [Oceanimonas pelagia]